jgi:hypothetical protein
MAGIDQTKEAIIGIFALSAFLVDRFNDGVGVDDLAATYSKYMTDKVFQDKLKKAADHYKEIPEELKDMKFDEMVAMSVLLVPEVLAVIAKIPPEKMEKITEAMGKLVPVITKALVKAKLEDGAK